MSPAPIAPPSDMQPQDGALRANLASGSTAQSPAHLRGAAYLYGIEAPSAQQARVLALGCGAAEGLLSYAAGYPQAQILGIDLDPASIQEGQQRAQAAGLANIQLYALDLGDLLAQQELGAFDYILVGGVFSLVSGDTRLEILRFCQRSLGETGIICFEYSTYPGGRLNEIIRDALVLHSSLAADPDQQVASARAMLTFLNQGVSAQNPLSGQIRQLAAQADSGSDVSLALKYLQGLNEPCHFVEFNALAEEAGLCYVGDAQPHLELPEAWGENVARLCATINPRGNKLLAQQYLDFACNRSSRMSLLAKQNRAESVLPLPDARRLKDLRLSGYFRLPPVMQGKLPDHFKTPSHEALVTQKPAYQAILGTLGWAWPASVGFDALRIQATSPVEALGAQAGEAAGHELDETLVGALGELFIHLGGDLKYSPDRSPYDDNGAPCLAPVPGLALDGMAAARNLWHEPVHHLEALDLAILSGLNGSTSVERLAARLEKEPSLFPAGAAPAEAVTHSLDKLYRLGLLHGSNAAWIDYWQWALIAIGLPQQDIHPVCSLLMRCLKSEQGGIGDGTLPLERIPAPQSQADVLDLSIQKVRLLFQAGQIDNALELSRTLTQSFPDASAAWHVRYLALNAAKQISGVLETALHLLRLQPAQLDCYLDVATIYSQMELLWNSASLLEKVLRAEPGSSNAWTNLGRYYIARHQYRDAEACFRAGIRHNPRNRVACSNLAGVLSMQGKTEESLDTFEKAIEMDPGNFVLYSNYLFASQHAGTLTPEELLRRHRKFGERAEASVPKGARVRHDQRDRTPDRPLRLGFVSADLRSHALVYFVEPYLANLDRSAFSIHVYSNSVKTDAVTERLKTYADSWHSVVDLRDEQLVRLIAEEKIDILFDLSGHTGGNRLPAFAYKPAPVQISWLGYPGTTGLRDMDYMLFSGPHGGRAEWLEQQFLEKIMYVALPATLFSHGSNTPPVSDLPCLNGNPFTFGSFNRPQKLSDDLLEAWAKILHATPGSRLLQGGLDLSDAPSASGRDFVEKMQALGIPRERLILKPQVDLNEYLRMHSDVDVLLDTYPYTGGTTTNHALWMGVPTITQWGDTSASLCGLGLASQWDLLEFAAGTRQEYIDCAVKWSHRQAELAEIRRNLRPRIAASMQEQNTLSTRKLEQGLRQAWQRWCAGRPADVIYV